MLALALVAIFGLASYVATFLFNSYPYSMDEQSVMFQAGIFADGALSRSATPYSSIITETWVIVRDGKVFSKYPPALAALLAAPYWMGIPQLLNPLLSTLTAFFVFRLTQFHFGTRIAWIILAIVGTSPYFYPYAASFFPQPLALSIATFCLLLVSQHIARYSRMRCFLMGAAVGVLLLARQLDAACLFVALAGAICFASPRGQKLQALSALCGGTLPGFLLLILYNYLQIGELSISAFSVWQRDFALAPAMGGGIWSTGQKLISNFSTWFFTHTVKSFYVDLLPYVGVPLFSLFVVGLLTMRATASRWAAFFIVLVVCAYVMHPSAGWPQYGQRYWYVCLGAFLLIVAQGVVTVQGWTSPRARIVFYSILFGTQLVTLVLRLSEFERRFELQEAIWRDISRVCPDRTIVVLKKPQRIDIEDIQFFVGSDFKRNSPPLGERFIVLEADDVLKLNGNFPSYPRCFYDFRGGDLRRKLPGFPPRDPLSSVRLW